MAGGLISSSSSSRVKANPLTGDLRDDLLASADLINLPMRREKEENSLLINPSWTDRCVDVVDLEEAVAVAVGWAEEMGLTLVANVNLTDIVAAIDPA